MTLVWVLSLHSLMLRNGLGTSGEGSIKTTCKVASSRTSLAFSRLQLLALFLTLCDPKQSRHMSLQGGAGTPRCSVPAGAVAVWLKSSWAVWRQKASGLVQTHCICPG